MSSRNNQSFPLGLVGKIGIFMLVAGGGAAWFTLNTINSQKITLTPVVTQSYKPSVISTKETRPVYWVKITQDKTELVSTAIPVKSTDNKTSQIKDALTQLLAGHNEQDISTLIPAGTKLLDYQVDQKGIHLNLSREFAEGGGSASLIGRLGQVIYTATSLDVGAKVWLNVEGKPLELLGEGDGLMVEQPMTREKFKQDYQL